MTDFKTNLETLPTVDHLAGLNVLEGEKVIHNIPAIAGKLGSLRVYNALAQNFAVLNRASAQKGLEIFAEHVADAEQNPGKHPNIDLLFKVVNGDLTYQLVPLVD